MGSNGTGPGLLLTRCTVLGALVGLPVGLYEAIHLYSTPRIPALLEPDVRFVIWFLAPLANLAFFGVLGLLVGLLSAGRYGGNWRRVALALAAGLGVVLACVTCLAILVLIQTWVGSPRPDPPLLKTAVWFLVTSCAVVVAYHFWSKQARRFFAAVGSLAVKPLVMVLAVSAAIILAGVVVFVAGGPAPAASSAASSPSPAPRPNIVLLSLDTVRADHLSVYGYRLPTSPNLERWARQGVLFENAIANSSWTLPSHASLLTGLLPHQHGGNWYDPIDTTRWTLAEVLRSRGYETVGFTSNLFYGQAGWGMGQGFEIYEDDGSSLRHNLATTLVGRTLVQWLHDFLLPHDRFDRRDARQVNRDIFRWFQTRSGRPFFLFVNYLDAHFPYLAPSPYDARFGETSQDVLRKTAPVVGHHVSKPVSDLERRSLIAAYDNCLGFLDDQVGELLRFLGQQRAGSNTIVMIIADHGENFGEHGSYGHGQDLYREVLRVPLIIFGPGIPVGRRITQTVSLRRLFATVLDLSLVEGPAFRHMSLRRLWMPGVTSQSSDEVVISEVMPGFGRPGVPPVISLMTPEWHYLRNARDSVELYHWPSDLEERMDLADSPHHQQMIRFVENYLTQRVGFSLRPWKGPQYLSALDQPGHSFLRDTAFGLNFESSLFRPAFRIGASQAYFPPSAPSPSLRPRPPDEELLRSLPYH